MADVFNQFKERKMIVSAESLMKHSKALLNDNGKVTVVNPSPKGDKK